ncbi:MAG: glycosyltransferase family 4 protein [Methanobacterium sp.]|jgi:glycosyltransferase involved in cell wall biosynthesis
MKSLKIAVFHNLPSGGAKRALYGLLSYLNRSGHIIDIFVPSTANENFLPLQEVTRKVEIFPVKKSFWRSMIYSKLEYVPAIIKPISFRDLEKTEKEIANYINAKDYDVVLSEQDQYTMSPFFLKYIKKPVVYYCQQPQRNEEILEKISKDKRNSKLEPIIKIGVNYIESKESKIDKQNSSFAKYTLSNSYFSRESILRTYGLNSFVSYLGIDIELFKPLGIAKEDFVLSVGTIIPSKGYDFILRSLGKINYKSRPKLVIVSNFGDAKWKSYIEKVASEYSVELEILDLIDDDELVILYNKAKLILYAPYLEPFGLVPLEAMGCGTPVVGVKEGGVRETVIHNKTGLLTERDEDLFANAVSELLLNDEKREELGQNAIEIVKNFWTIEHAGERLLWHLKRGMNLE